MFFFRLYNKFWQITVHVTFGKSAFLENSSEVFFFKKSIFIIIYLKQSDVRGTMSYRQINVWKYEIGMHCRHSVHKYGSKLLDDVWCAWCDGCVVVGEARVSFCMLLWCPGFKLGRWDDGKSRKPIST